MQDRRVVPTIALSPRGHALRDSRMRTVFKAVTDKMIGAASRAIDQDIDENISRALMLDKNELGIDPFGVDADTLRLSASFLSLLNRFYFRTEVHGIENVPQGRVLLVSNHAGQIPLDGVVIATSMILDAKPPRLVRAMVERFVSTLPYFSIWFTRVGQVLGAPENAKRLLESDEALLVFPEGVKGISKTFDERYKLAPFGPGFMRLALETNSPIVPIAVIGSEEQYPSVGELKGLAKLIGAPAIPIIPQLFFGMPLPLPVKYHLYFGEPLFFSGDPDDEDSAIDEKVWVVQATVQSMVNRGLKERKGIFW
jgi:1-acyl-sn-glycerol-3-phosphate acyltransferase